ncbi:glycosyltransferase family 4 protein [Terriglobus roseus]|nr:glycosyltransferase family 4 protein [Terriglobus roseus]
MLLRRIAADPDIDLKVFFCSDLSLRKYKDPGFGVDVEWDVPLTEGYRSVVLSRWRDTDKLSPTRPISRGMFRALAGGIDSMPFDAMWVHGYSTVNSLHAIFSANALGIPVLLRAESWLADRDRSSTKLALKQLYLSGLKLLVDAVLPIGTRNAEYWTSYFGSDFPAFTMPYAVDNEYFASRAASSTLTRQKLQAELSLDPSRPVILFASKLQERKHADHLLEAYLRLRSETTLTPYLLIVGDGEMRAQLQQRAEASGMEGIRFLGFRNQSELPRFFDLSTVFVLPSRHEAWGLITNEAMATGLPVIVSSDVGCAADLLRDGENGYVYPVGDIAKLRDALAATLEPGKSERMGQRSRDILSRWSYREDLRGLKEALRYVTKLPIQGAAK